MDINKIETLYRTAHYGSINKAAEKMNYTQSGLLYVINSVEQDLGVALLNRNHKGVTLTEAGQELEPVATSLFDDKRIFEETVDRLTGHHDMVLRVGAHPSIANQWVTEVIKRLHGKGYDHFQIFAGTNEIERWMEDDVIDLAVVGKGMAGENQWVYLTNDELYAVVPAGCPIEGSRVALKELEGYQVLLPNYNTKSLGNDMVREWVESRNVSKDMSVLSSNGALLLNMVSKGLGITFLSSLYKNECPDTVRMLSLDPPVMREIGVIFRPRVKVTPLMKLFISELKQLLSQG